jgi:hypothetical protein
MIKVKAFRAFMRVYSLSGNCQLNASIKSTLHKAVICSVMTYACPVLQFWGKNHFLKLQHMLGAVLRSISKAHTSSRFARGPHLNVYVWLCHKIIRMQVYATEDKAKPDRGCRGMLNLSAVKLTAFSVTYLPLCGRAIFQAVSRRLPTAAARVRAQVRSCGICGGQSGTGAGFLRVLRFLLLILIPPTAPHSSSSIIRGW